MEQKSQKGLLTIIGILVLVIAVLVYFFYVKTTGKTVPEANTSSATALSTASVSVGNAIPVASNASLNGGSDITLFPSPATTAVTVAGTVSDANGCNDISTVNIAVYKQGTTCFSSGNANDDTCYFTTIASSSAEVSQCLGGSDTSANVSHTFNFKSYAQPGTWLTTITPVDIETSGTPSTVSVAVAETVALSADPSLNYGSVAGGASSQGTNTLAINNLGNKGIDLGIQGQDLICTGANALGSIPVGNLQYSQNSFSYPNGISLTLASVFAGQLQAPSQSHNPVSATSYWQVAVPSGVRGSCSGQITFTATATTTQQQQGQNLEWAAIDSPLTPVTWDGAVSGCATLPTAGGSAWRLPTKDELTDKYNLTHSTPAGFQVARYWSSTETGNPAYAYYFDMGTGFFMGDSKTGNTNLTRCVR